MLYTILKIGFCILVSLALLITLYWTVAFIAVIVFLLGIIIILSFDKDDDNDNNNTMI
jgi:heme/copper-type cytochrome/quinol oxidase subunit 2